MNKRSKKKTSSAENRKFPLPIYGKGDDIYTQEKGQALGDEEQFGERKSVNMDKNLEGDLDIPGTELDDVDEEIGEEDEENNYYSLGGDNHSDLEEDNS